MSAEICNQAHCTYFMIRENDCAFYKECTPIYAELKDFENHPPLGVVYQKRKICLDAGDLSAINANLFEQVIFNEHGLTLWFQYPNEALVLEQLFFHNASPECDFQSESCSRFWSSTQVGCMTIFKGEFPWELVFSVRGGLNLLGMYMRGNMIVMAVVAKFQRGADPLDYYMPIQISLDSTETIISTSLIYAPRICDTLTCGPCEQCDPNRGCVVEHRKRGNLCYSGVNLGVCDIEGNCDTSKKPGCPGNGELHGKRCDDNIDFTFQEVCVYDKCVGLPLDICDCIASTYGEDQRGCTGRACCDVGGCDQSGLNYPNCKGGECVQFDATEPTCGDFDNCSGNCALNNCECKRCDGGVCSETAPYLPNGLQCSVGRCYEGVCEPDCDHVPAKSCHNCQSGNRIPQNGGTCDDGDKNTSSDTCENGQCIGTPDQCAGKLCEQCHECVVMWGSGMCSVNNDCTSCKPCDECHGCVDGACAPMRDLDGLDCISDDPYAGMPTCENGECIERFACDNLCDNKDCRDQTSHTSPCCPIGGCDQTGAGIASCNGGYCIQINGGDCYCDGGFCDQTLCTQPRCPPGNCIGNCAYMTCPICSRCELGQCVPDNMKDGTPCDSQGKVCHIGICLPPGSASCECPACQECFNGNCVPVTSDCNDVLVGESECFNGVCSGETPQSVIFASLKIISVTKTFLDVGVMNAAVRIETQANAPHFILPDDVRIENSRGDAVISAIKNMIDCLSKTPRCTQEWSLEFQAPTISPLHLLGQYTIFIKVDNLGDAITIPLTVELTDESMFELEVLTPIWSDFGVRTETEDSFGPPATDIRYPVGSDMLFRLLTWEVYDDVSYSSPRLILHIGNHSIAVTDDASIKEQMGNPVFDKSEDGFEWKLFLAPSVLPMANPTVIRVSSILTVTYGSRRRLAETQTVEYNIDVEFEVDPYLCEYNGETFPYGVSTIPCRGNAGEVMIATCDVGGINIKTPCPSSDSFQDTSGNSSAMTLGAIVIGGIAIMAVVFGVYYKKQNSQDEREAPRKSKKSVIKGVPSLNRKNTPEKPGNPRKKTPDGQTDDSEEVLSPQSSIKKLSRVNSGGKAKGTKGNSKNSGPKSPKVTRANSKNGSPRSKRKKKGKKETSLKRGGSGSAKKKAGSSGSLTRSESLSASGDESSAQEDSNSETASPRNKKRRRKRRKSGRKGRKSVRPRKSRFSTRKSTHKAST